MKFTFGHTEHERLEVDVLGFERSETGDYWDDNWLRARIIVSAGDFRGDTRADIRSDELARFADGLHVLYDTLRGSAEFHTLEHQLSLKLTGDGIGHIELRGEVRDDPSFGNHLSFTIAFDQTQLREHIHELDTVVRAFPVRHAKA